MKELTHLQLKCYSKEEWTSGMAENWSNKTADIKSTGILPELAITVTVMKMFTVRRADVFV